MVYHKGQRVVAAKPPKGGVTMELIVVFLILVVVLEIVRNIVKK